MCMCLPPRTRVGGAPCWSQWLSQLDQARRKWLPKKLGWMPNAACSFADQGAVELPACMSVPAGGGAVSVRGSCSSSRNHLRGQQKMHTQRVATHTRSERHRRTQARRAKKCGQRVCGCRAQASLMKQKMCGCVAAAAHAHSKKRECAASMQTPACAYWPTECCTLTIGRWVHCTCTTSASCDSSQRQQIYGRDLQWLPTRACAEASVCTCSGPVWIYNKYLAQWVPVISILLWYRYYRVGLQKFIFFWKNACTHNLETCIRELSTLVHF